MNEKSRRAANLLVYYFKLCAKASGAKWDSNNEAEIRSIVEDIFDSAGEYTDEAIDNHNNSQISHKV